MLEELYARLQASVDTLEGPEEAHPEDTSSLEEDKARLEELKQQAEENGGRLDDETLLGIVAEKLLSMEVLNHG